MEKKMIQKVEIIEPVILGFWIGIGMFFANIALFGILLALFIGNR